MDRLKIAMFFVFVIGVVWFIVSEKLNESIRNTCVFISVILGLIGFTSNLIRRPIYIFFMLFFGVMYTCFILMMHIPSRQAKDIKLKDIGKRVWLDIIFTINLFWAAMAF